MAIVSRRRVGEYTLAIEADPDGEWRGTWGYIVSNDHNDGWWDGGYESREEAEAEGRALIGRLERDYSR